MHSPLTELLAVLAILTVRSLIALPALAGMQNKSGRMQCADNLRQIGMGSKVYAGENDGWLPVWGGYDALHPVNLLRGIHYTRYVYIGSTSDTVVPTNSTPVSQYYQNLGYLYRSGLAGNGTIFKVTPKGTLTMLAHLNSSEGAEPFAGMVADPHRRLLRHNKIRRP